MIKKLALTVALLLAAATAVSAQDTTPPANSGDDRPATRGPERVVAPHGTPSSCPYPGSSCVWGQLVNSIGPLRDTPIPLEEGPIDVCHSWDYNCSVPVQTVCELHGPHGWWRWGRDGEEEGSFFFVLRTNLSWRIKPRVAGSHSSWNPSQRIVPRGVAPGSLRVFNFALLGRAPSTRICD